MHRLYVLADHLRRYDLLGIGLAMLDGSYWKESIYDDRNFNPASDPSADFAGGD